LSFGKEGSADKWQIVHCASICFQTDLETMRSSSFICLEKKNPVG